MNVAAQVRLDQTDNLLEGRSPGGTWPRWGVWLIRLAIEHELDALWARRSPTGMTRSRRSQLLALGVVVDSDTQHRVTELWNTLSRAAHHHHYELAPTAAEVRGWLREARRLCTHLANHV
ncbi:hypothetical protein ACQPZQ_34310 [Pseudonocardia sp. CA-142604]|uniref:hypothetical protein n=1 Tax=Pseudonocardia sp. CA-142604 TaxID=3240024 RepID=UPI003D8F4AC9